MEITKMRKILLIIVSVLMSIVIISMVYNGINSKIEEDKIQLNEEKIQEIIENGSAVKDYPTFYNLKSACGNYLSALLSDNHSKTYKVLSPKLKKKMSLISYVSKVDKYKSNHFSAVSYNYNIADCLYKAYFYKENGNYVRNVYICQLKTGVPDEYLNIVIRLETSGKLTYKIWYVGV